MDADTRATLTGMLWFFSAIVLAALFISAAAQGALTAGHILITFVLLGLAVTGTLFIIKQRDDETQQSKTKRQRLDSVLHDLSDDDLAELKQRLYHLEYRETPISDYVGDDGELLRRS